MTREAPFWTGKFATLYRGRCEDVLPTLVDTVHLIVTDPPYGVEWCSNKRTEGFGFMEGDSPDYSVADALRPAFKLLARGRHCYVFGPLDLSSLPLCEPVELIWNKDVVGLGDLSAPWGTSHERIQFAVYEPSRANREKGYGRLAARLRKQSVLTHQRPQGAAVRHPTEKPVGLLRELIESSSCIGETVLDPFAGSGSTLVAAVLEGRHAIGVEVNPDYCAIAADRLREAQRIAGEAA